MNSSPHYAVTVVRDGEPIVTIESNCLSGRNLQPGDEQAIQWAIDNLSGFVGQAHIVTAYPALQAQAEIMLADLLRIGQALVIPARPYSGHEAVDRDYLPRIAELVAACATLRATLQQLEEEKNDANTRAGEPSS